jgi:hypothetical protein
MREARGHRPVMAEDQHPRAGLGSQSHGHRRMVVASRHATVRAFVQQVVSPLDNFCPNRH